MNTTLAYAGAYLLSLFVALLAALQLADYFGASEAFILVLVALPVLAGSSLLAFIAAAAETGPATMAAMDWRNAGTAYSITSLSSSTAGLTCATCLRSMSRISAGVLPEGSAPTSFMRLATSGRFTASAICC